MNYKYRKGQRVRVRPDLIVRYKDYFMRSGPNPSISDIVNENMEPYAGKEIVIECIGTNGKYRALGWNWTDEMFSDFSKPFVCKSLL